MPGPPSRRHGRRPSRDSAACSGVCSRCSAPSQREVIATATVHPPRQDRFHLLVVHAKHLRIERIRPTREAGTSCARGEYMKTALPLLTTLILSSFTLF